MRPSWCIASWVAAGQAVQWTLQHQHWELEAPSPDAKPDCTYYSFTYPLWRIYDPIYIIPNWTGTHGIEGSTRGDFWFTIHNLGTNAQVECEIKDADLYSNETRDSSEDSWHSCKNNATQFRMSLKWNEFQLRENWECAEPPRNIKFSGLKKTRMPVYLGCEEMVNEKGPYALCFMANVNIEPTLVTPVQMDIVTPSWPYELHFSADTCGERSEIPAWTVTDFKYDRPARAGGGEKPPTAGLSFNVHNLANLETLACSVRVDETALDRSHDEPWVDCSSTSGSGKFLSTKVLFSKKYSLLGINQTWLCGDNSLSRGGQTTFGGVGYLELPLSCTNESTAAGRPPSPLACSMAATNFTGYSDIEYIPTFPHTYYTRSCMINSINVTALTLREYKIDANARTARLRVYNPGPGEEYRIALADMKNDGAWHACYVGTDSLPWQLVSCQYQLSGAENLGLQLQWYCDDRNPDHALLISATASAQLGGNSGGGLTLNVSALSWNTTSGPMDRGPPLPWV